MIFQKPTSLEKNKNADHALSIIKRGYRYYTQTRRFINTLTLQDVKDSSAIENIITTHDELSRNDTTSNNFANIQAEEVHNYSASLKKKTLKDVK